MLIHYSYCLHDLLGDRSALNPIMAHSVNTLFLCTGILRICYVVYVFNWITFTGQVVNMLEIANRSPFEKVEGGWRTGCADLAFYSLSLAAKSSLNY